MILHESVKNPKSIKKYKEFKEICENKFPNIIYDDTVYINSTTKLKIICKEHGVSEQYPLNHVKSKTGCRLCGQKIKSNNQKDDLETFIKKAECKHNKLYTYGEQYGGKIEIFCREHGKFLQGKKPHIQGNGCPKCARIRHKKALTTNNNKIIERAKSIHNNLYSYENFIFITTNDKAIITCREHGDFNQLVSNHLAGAGCPKCANMKRGDTNIRDVYENKRTILYFIKIGNLYKVGLTMESVEKRYRYDNIDYEILSEEVFENGSLAWDKEKELLASNKNYYYGPKIIKGGNTELRTKEF